MAAQIIRACRLRAYFTPYIPEVITFPGGRVGPVIPVREKVFTAGHQSRDGFIVLAQDGQHRFVERDTVLPQTLGFFNTDHAGLQVHIPAFQPPCLAGPHSRA